MIFNKKKLIILSLAIILLVSSHVTQAFSFKSFFNTVFGRNKIENTQPASSAIPTKIEVSKPASITTEDIKTDDISFVDEVEEINPANPAEETVDIIKETEAILKYGMTNSTNVSIVQEHLKKLGYFDEIIDGGYGKMTASAVALFQKENSIDGSDGMVVGVYTIKALGITLLPKDKPLKPLTINVTVISPNGGEVYAQGQQMTVTWTSTGFSGNSLVNIDLATRDINGNYNNTFLMSVDSSANDGTHTFTIPTNVPNANNYSMRIYAFEAGGITPVADHSDGLFTITNQSTSLDQILFLGGGIVTQNTPFNDVYSSDNMQQWNLISPNGSTPKWSKKFYPEAFYFNNKYWVIGGMTNINSTTSMDNSVWSSPDGITWALVTSTVPFSDYANFKITTLNGKIYVIGGRIASSGALSEAKVWSSPDGVNWVTNTSSAPFGPRVGHEVITLNGKAYVIGGINPTNSTPSQYLSDVWSTSDGLNWSLLNANAPFGQLSYPIGVVHQNKIFLMGGTEQVPFSVSRKVWSSSDGIAWTLITSNMPYYENIFSAMTDAVVANGKIWLGNGINNGINKLWSTTDGATWEQAPAPLPWSPRYGYRFIARPQTPVTTCVINSFIGNPATIPSGSSNLTWTTTGCDHVSIGGVLYPSNGSTLVTPGITTTYTLTGSSYAGCNGTTYSTITGQLCDYVTQSTVITVASSSNSLTDMILFMGGGNENGGYQSFNDAYNNLIPGCLSILGYSSTSGQPCNTPTTNWNQISVNTTSVSKWSARRNFQTVHYDNRYWVIGGETPNGLAKDVWNSVDGVTWNQVATTTPFGMYNQYKSIVFNNKIYVVGGRASPSSTAFAKAWSTTDGINWTTTTLPFKDRENPTLGVMNNKLFVIGGVETVGAQSDSWSTIDGINWIQMNYFIAKISNGKILRGYDDYYYFLGGTYWNTAGMGGSSTTAIRRYNTASDSWDLIGNTFPSPSSGFTEIDAVVANGKIWVSGQASVSPYTNHLWSSADGGITWIEENINLPWSPRHAYKMVVQYY